MHLANAACSSTHQSAACSYSTRSSSESLHSRFSNEQPEKESMRETNMPRAFMSIATSSIAPTPAREMPEAKEAKSGKGVPAPHSPRRVM